jgi:hypothetical protein
MNCTIQTITKPYYTVTQYKGTNIVLPSTHETMYNLSDIFISNYQSLSEWVKVCKENCKRFTKTQSTKKVNKQIHSEIIAKKERRANYIANDKLAYMNKISHPNYNPFSPLFEGKLKRKTSTATMDDETARQRFFKAMNGDYNETAILTPTHTNKETQINHTEQTLTMDTTDPIVLEANTVAPAITDATSGTTTITKHDELLAQVSDTYAPVNLTWESNYKPRGTDITEGTQDHRFALVVRIGQKKNQKLKFNEARILTSILTSLQKVSSQIKITSYDKQRSNISDIESPEQIVFNEQFYNHYMEDPITTKNNHFICRLHFIAKKPFFWFKQNIFFQKWLTLETIRLEENNLREIHCPKVGFLTQCHPRASLIKVFEERIKQTLSSYHYPPFYCAIEHISIRQTTTKVVVIRSAEKDVAELLDLFKKAGRIHFHKFVPWREWNAMISPKQLDLIQKQNKNITSSKSIIVSGFKDNESVKFNYSLVESDDMIYVDEDDEKQNNQNANQSSVTVAEFLYRHYKDCEGNELFTYVYPVALGVREMLVEHRHAKEVIELCKVIKQDMFLYMSLEAAEEIFDNIEQIQNKAIHHIKWEPFLTPTDYNEAYDDPSNIKSENDRKHYKRSSDTDLQKAPKLSYAQSVTNTAKNAPTTIQQVKHQEQPLHSLKRQDKPSEEMLLVRQQLMELQTKQHLFQANQEKTNTHVLAEIKSTNDIIHKKVMVIMEKTSRSILDIRKEVISMKTMTSQVQHIINMMNDNIQKEEDKLQTSGGDMMIDKDINKRNLHGNLRDSDGNIQNCQHNKENIQESITTGGNHNNCNIYEIDYVGANHP